MTVAVEGIQRHVADDADVGDRLLDRLNGAADQVVGVQGLAGVGRFQALVNGRKKGDGGNAQVPGLGHRIDQKIDAEPVDAGHGGNGFALAFAFDHENGPDQVVGAETVFGHQAA